MRRLIRGDVELPAKLADIGDAVRAGDYTVDEITVSAQISADGKIGFLGTGASVGGEAGINLLFRRKT